jgi:hypothetical protein
VDACVVTGISGGSDTCTTALPESLSAPFPDASTPPYEVSRSGSSKAYSSKPRGRKSTRWRTAVQLYGAPAIGAPK